MVEIVPGKEGLVHVSEMSTEYVNSPEDVVQIGQTVKVFVKEKDDQGRYNLSMVFGERPERTGQEGGGGGGGERPRRDDRPRMGGGGRDYRSGPPRRESSSGPRDWGRSSGFGGRTSGGRTSTGRTSGRPSYGGGSRDRDRRGGR